MSGELLSVGQMAAADRETIAGGIPGITLMEAAGRAVADRVAAARAEGPVLVLCGPGNNGGDGFVAARLLAERGRAVEVVLFCDRAALKGDAAIAAERWAGPVEMRLNRDIAPNYVVIDAIFGAGLSRAPEGDVAAALQMLACSSAYIVAVDVPTGVVGDTGTVLGMAVRADETVTFFRKKPAHVLLPGRVQCGKIFVEDIGISPQVFKKIEIMAFENGPELWRSRYPLPSPETHKYARGHVGVFTGGPLATGAGRLAGRGALRIGAGLVTLLGPKEACPVLAMHATAMMVAQCDAPPDALAYINRKRVNAAVLGPGQGIGEATRQMTLALRSQHLALVLDADALTSGAERPETFFGYPSAVLTPHEGEFARLFPDITGDKLSRARAAAARAGCVVLIKGSDTVIAAPSGRAVINANAPPWLATAGAGDVLAGFIAGLLAQGMEPFDAACAGAWLHGEAARRFGLGLTAEDLPEILPDVLRELFAQGRP